MLWLEMLSALVINMFLAINIDEKCVKIKKKLEQQKLEGKWK